MKTPIDDVMKTILNFVMWFGAVFIVLGIICILVLALYSHINKEPSSFVVWYRDILTNGHDYVSLGTLSSIYFIYSLLNSKED